MRPSISNLVLSALVAGIVLAAGPSALLAQTPTLPAKVVSVPQALKQAIASKPTTNTATLQTSVSLKGSLPVLRLSPTKTVILQPATALEPQVPPAIVAKSRQLPASLTSFKQHIETPYIATQAPATLTLDRPLVDLKSRQTAIRDQGTRGTCTAFASAAALEAQYKARNNAVYDLSEQHVFRVFQANNGHYPCEDEGFATWQTAAWLTQARTCTEAQERYTDNPPACNSVSGGTCMQNRKYGFTSTEVILGRAFGGVEPHTANNTNYLEAILAAGNEIVFGIYLAGTDWTGPVSRNGIIDVQLNPTRSGPAEAWASHAMLLVGYNRTARYFEFKNSWGTDAGHAGYFRVSYHYVQVYGKYGYYVTGVTTP